MSHTWTQLMKEALRLHGQARDHNRQVQLTLGLPREEKDAAAQAEFDAQETVSKLCYNAAQDLLFMFRMAVRLFGDDFRDLLREALKKSPVPAGPEDERREVAMSLYLRILDAGAVVTSDGVKNTDKLSSLDKKLIPKFKDELMLLMKPE